MANSNEPNRIVPDSWDAKEALESLVTERECYGEMVEGGEQTTANRIFREALPMAARVIVHTAQHSRNERLRFTAAQYVVERNIGRLADTGILNSSAGIGDKNPLEALLGSIVRDGVNEAERFANS